MDRSGGIFLTGEAFHPKSFTTCRPIAPAVQVQSVPELDCCFRQEVAWRGSSPALPGLEKGGMEQEGGGLERCFSGGFQCPWNPEGGGDVTKRITWWRHYPLLPGSEGVASLKTAVRAWAEGVSQCAVFPRYSSAHCAVLPPAVCLHCGLLAGQWVACGTS